MADVMLSIGEAAKLMAVCENTLRNWDVEGKFPASERTQGEHRRYSLSSIRAYIDQQAKTKTTVEVDPAELRRGTNNTELIKRWEDLGHLNEVQGTYEKEILATLLDNAKLLRETSSESYSALSSDQIIWLTQQGWLRSKLRKLVSVHAMMGVCDLIYYRKENGKFEDKAVCVKTKKSHFAIFAKADWEKVKDAYADAIAAELDHEIYIHLPRINLENAIKASRHYTSMKEMYDYVVGPVGMIDEARQLETFNDVELYPMPTILDPNSFCPIQAGGKFPKGCVAPVFCPYIIVSAGPIVCGSVAATQTRFNWLE